MQVRCGERGGGEADLNMVMGVSFSVSAVGRKERIYMHAGTLFFLLLQHTRKNFFTGCLDMKTPKSKKSQSSFAAVFLMFFL